eukprot:286238_1
MKLIIINYVSIQSYFDRLQASDNINAEYYEFAKQLYLSPPKELYNIKLKHFDMNKQNKWVSNEQAATLVYLKMTQFSIRVIFVICCLFLDGLYIGTFATGSIFMRHYGKMISSFGVFTVMVFCVWLACIT